MKVISIKSKRINKIVAKLNARMVFAVIICFILIMLIINPSRYINSAFEGLLVWATIALPAMLPFLFFSKLLIELGMAQKVADVFAPIMSKIFKTSGIAAYIFVMSLISGYPVGAKLISDFYEKGYIDSAQSARISTFCSTSGPMFILGSIGIGLLSSYAAGLVLLISHILSAILNGLIFRNYKVSKEYSSSYTPPKRLTADNILTDCIYDTIISIFVVGGYIAIFFILSDIFNDTYILYPFKKMFEFLFNLLKINPQLSEGFTRGLLEVTNGCVNIASSKGNILSKTSLCGFIIAWGGISVHIQNLTFLMKAGVKIRFYFLFKTIQAITMLIFVFILGNIFL